MDKEMEQFQNDLLASVRQMKAGKSVRLTTVEVSAATEARNRVGMSQSEFAKYAERYLAEVQYRFNRRFDLGSILVRLVRAATLTRPRPEPMIRLAEVGG